MEQKTVCTSASFENHLFLAHKAVLMLRRSGKMDGNVTCDKIWAVSRLWKQQVYELFGKWICFPCSQYIWKFIYLIHHQESFQMHFVNSVTIRKKKNIGEIKSLHVELLTPFQQ